MLLQEILERCNLSAVSQEALASGPRYTFCSGDVCTTGDYVLMDVAAASMLVFFHTHRMKKLNTSDHLSLTVSLLYDVCKCTQSDSSTYKRIDWVEARKSGAREVFTAKVQASLASGSGRI